MCNPVYPGQQNPWALDAFLRSLLEDGIEFTLIKTGHAFYAFFLINIGNFFLLPCDGFHRTASKAKPAFGAHFRLYLKF
jgi:hypothetical protein